ncbi:MAG: hypothetical protein KF878_00100 [Planctomycetes bacterium]|nr:hypothetical protein [Planctomycetota bacterium]
MARNTLDSLAELDLSEQVHDLLRSVATRVTDDRAEGWAAQAIRQAQDAAQRRLDGLDRDMVLAGLRPLSRVTPELGRLGVGRLRAGLTLLHAGDSARADEALLAIEGLPHQERRRAFRDATLAVVDEADQRARDVAAVKRAIAAAGAEALRAAIPFLLAVLTRS